MVENYKERWWYDNRYNEDNNDNLQNIYYFQ